MALLEYAVLLKCTGWMCFYYENGILEGYTVAWFLVKDFHIQVLTVFDPKSKLWHEQFMLNRDLNLVYSFCLVI